MWCGARNGRRPHCAGTKRPAIDATAATSSASSSASGGKSDGSRCASIDLPVPGGPVKSSECPPAAAISSARFARACPRTSDKSGAAVAAGSAAGEASARSVRAVRCAHTASNDAAPYTVAPFTIAASAADTSGSTNARPSRRADSAIASAPRTARSSPVSASSPANS